MQSQEVAPTLFKVWVQRFNPVAVMVQLDNLKINWAKISNIQKSRFFYAIVPTLAYILFLLTSGTALRPFWSRSGAP